ncbi:Putative maltase glucoamylase [Caligus rogercresseyi]|uniref:Glucosidase II subunit alpha n=1 Tax=Caligus rogercresseyi TaxID=217165 RepID=A0A7T8HF88_CALRO|nr:Putative maltase glucoamylase [Caligus rogercresseyi]
MKFTGIPPFNKRPPRHSVLANERRLGERVTSPWAFSPHLPIQRPRRRMNPRMFIICLLLASLAAPSRTVDHAKFRTCAQSGFCTRCRSDSSGLNYRLDPETLRVVGTTVEALLFRLELESLSSGSFRFALREAFPLHARFSPAEHILLPNLERQTLRIKSSDKDGVILESGENELHVSNSPTLSLNARNLLRFEETRKKASESEGGGLGSSLGGVLWREHGLQAVGPQAVALDIRFHDSKHVYGIPEHADRFSLEDTVGKEPYRLYNLDVFEYEVWSPMALYAAVPFMMGHNKQRSSGVFWMNAAETWIDVKKSGGGVLDSLAGLVSPSAPFVDTHWMSEAGILEVFLLLGPGPKEVSKQYGALTGNTPLPHMFSLAYHQCRWNYNDQKDVHEVETQFDKHDIPMDVMWLDIEHTDGKKYFTWDPVKFSDPLTMTHNLTAHGRKLVTIVDPHIKKDSDYWVHQELTSLGLYTKNLEGKDYEGWCWPGASYYPDFLNLPPKSTLQNSTLWINTVFNGPEVTMPKDLIHHGDHEHREIHNMTPPPLPNKLRPYILTRSAFAGSQRYTSIWTGDNTAEWSHVEASVPMCLSLGISGLSQCGSDVGGFFGNPDGEMFARWYQAAAFQPFFRSHAHIDTKRREPWLFPKELKHIRNAIRLRYSYLPLWYTLFYEGELSGVPPMRPLFYEFPQDEESFGLDKEHLVGDALLVRPVVNPGVSSVDVYFPPNSIWYDIFTHKPTSAHGNINVPVTMDSIPVYQRGGSIIPKKERVRRSSKLMAQDPYTLVVALDENQSAEGRLFIDDGESYAYRNGEHLYIKFTFANKVLSGHLLESPGYKTSSWLERVIIMGLKDSPNKITVSSPLIGEIDAEFTYKEGGVLTIRKPSPNIAEEWSITLH